MIELGRHLASAHPSMLAGSRRNGLGHSESGCTAAPGAGDLLIVHSVGLEESIRQDVAAIREWPFLPEYTKVVGYAFEVETGRVREVVGA